MKKDFEAAFSRSSHSNLRDVGWCIILQKQNTSSHLDETLDIPKISVKIG